MTGIECLREEMAKRGCTKAQIDSKGVTVALDILSGSPEMIFTARAAAEKELEVLLSKKRWIAYEIERLTKQKAELQNDIERCEKDVTTFVNDEWKREQQYIDDFYEAVKTRETAEHRDRVKNAQLFLNSIDINTPYDNTAKIVWLGVILSGSDLNFGLEEMRKINPTPVTGVKRAGRRL